jgi:nitroreductase
LEYNDILFIKEEAMTVFVGKAKNILRPIKHILIDTKQNIENLLIPMIANSGFFSSLFYTFFSTQFYREHQSVLHGRIKYKRSLNDIEESCALLRRNVHRLEKGLIMSPRRAIFASGYIGETVDCFLKAITSEGLCNNEKKWAEDVITEYFSVVDDDAKIKDSRAKFTHVSSLVETSSVPYKYSELPKRVVSYDELMTTFKRRRSVRWYKDAHVPKALIEKVVSAASLAPSACNRQPFKFHTVYETDLATEIADYAMGTAGWSHSINTLLVVVGNLGAYPNERDRHVIYIDGALASMQLMLACEALGLASCPINWPDIEKLEKKMAKALKLEPYERPIMLISVGYPLEDGGIPYSDKKTPKILIKEVYK